MHMRQAAATLLPALSIFLATHATAGEFFVSCSYSNDNLSKCATVIRDLVTDKFTSKYPATRFEIFLHSDVMGFTDGGYSAFAIAGVAQRGSTDFPIRRFTSVQINGTNNRFSAVELAEIELQVYRQAAKRLMDACEISPTCDVFQPHRK